MGIYPLNHRGVKGCKMAKKKAKSKKSAGLKKAKKAKKAVKKKGAKKAKPAAKKKAFKRFAKAKKAVKPSKPAAAVPKKNRAGTVTHFYSNISVAVIKVEDTLKVGDKISIEGATTNFTQKIDSMQVEHEQISVAKPGDEIGMKVKDKVREGDVVYKA